MKQLSFLPKIDLLHGGEHRHGKRKIMRPIDPKRCLHVVLRSSRARGNRSMLAGRNRRRIDGFARKTAEKHGVKLYRYANVGSHLHFLVKTPSRPAFQAFLREVTGGIAMLVTGARKTRAGKFWDGLAFTRIVEWGRDHDNVVVYFMENLFEANGLLTRKMKEAGVKVIPVFGVGARDPSP